MIKTYIKYFIPVVIFLLLSSCKSTKTVASGTTISSLKTKDLIAYHYDNQLDFKTLRGKVKINYSNGKDSQNMSVSFRMKKDKAIWLSATLGVVKVYITPDEVSFYNKLDKEYFKGDFSYLSKLLGTDVDFNKVQNLLLGNAFFDLRNEKYTSTIIDGKYALQPKRANELFSILYLLEPGTYKVATQQVTQPSTGQLLKIDYSYQNISDKILPKQIDIEAKETNHVNTIDLSYNNFEFDQQLNFPYKIPKGYKKITLESR